MKHLYCAEVHSYLAKRAVFRTRLKLLLQCDGSRRLSGSEFHAIGPPTEKDRRPNVVRLNRGTVMKWRLADRRCCRLATSDTGMQQSTRYFGALLWRHRWTITASLYCTLSGALSQCSSSCRRQDKPWSNLRVPETRRAAAFSIRWSVSVMYWGDPASTVLQ